MDKSVAQKFTIIMSMFLAVFATVFVCGNIVNGGISDSYTSPLTQTGNAASYSDIYVNHTYDDADDAVSQSDTYNYDNVTIVEFIDDEETEIPETDEDLQEDIFYDDEYLYVTTVTTTLRKTSASTVKSRTTTSARKTTQLKPKTTTTSAIKTTSASKSKTTTTTTSAAIKPSLTTSTTTSATSAVTQQTTSAAVSTAQPTVNEPPATTAAATTQAVQTEPVQSTESSAE